SGWISCAMRGNGSPVEPIPGTDEQLLPPPPPGPGTLGALRPPALNVFLFFLTFASAFVAGAVLNDTPPPEPTRPAMLLPGLRLSTLVPVEPESPHWSLFEAFFSLIEGRGWPAVRDAFDLGRPLGMVVVEKLVVGDLPLGKALALHPVAVAGWFGFLLTALNLLPLGQLDGGHVLYGTSPRLHRLLGPPISAVLLALGVFTAFPGWILWGLLMGLGMGFHPRLSEPEERLDGKRRLLVVASVAMLVLSFSPVPLALLAG